MLHGLRIESISQHLHSYYRHAGSFEAGAQQLEEERPTCLWLGVFGGVGSCQPFLEATISTALSVKMLGNSSGSRLKRGEK